MRPPFFSSTDDVLLGRKIVDFGFWQFPWFPYRVPASALLTHAQVTGASGSGKSRLLAHVCTEAILRGIGVVFIDPHGETADMVLSNLVARGFFDTNAGYKQLAFIDYPEAEHRKRYAGFNPLALHYEPQTTARLVLDAVRRAYPSVSGGIASNFENVLLAGISVLLYHGFPLTKLQDVLTNKPWRDILLAAVPDPMIVSFFHDRFDKWGRDQAHMLESTLNKVFLMLYANVTRYSLGQAGNLFDYKTHFEKGHSFILKLNVLDQDARQLLGCLHMVSIEQAAKARSLYPADTAFTPYLVVVDEFATFQDRTGTSFRTFLSETRKYDVFLWGANQDYEQITQGILAAFQNTGMRIILQQDRADAEVSARLVGDVDLWEVKHEVHDEHAKERSHPVFTSMPEQWERQVKEIMTLGVGEAIIHRKRRSAHSHHPSTVKVKTPFVAKNPADPKKLSQVRENYLAWCFRSLAEIETELNQTQAQPSPALPAFHGSRWSKISD